jgi:hypothetical protein
VLFIEKRRYYDELTHEHFAFASADASWDESPTITEKEPVPAGRQ